MILGVYSLNKNWLVFDKRLASQLSVGLSEIRGVVCYGQLQLGMAASMQVNHVVEKLWHCWKANQNLLTEKKDCEKSISFKKNCYGDQLSDIELTFVLLLSIIVIIK